MKFPLEGPLFSVVGLGVKSPDPNISAVGLSGRDKLKQVCSTLLHWDNAQFVEVEVIGG